MRGSRASSAGTRRPVLIAFAVLALLAASSAPAQQIYPSPAAKPGNPFCLKAEETWELYGPTDIGATTGNGRLSVAVNPQGTLSVLRWPSMVVLRAAPVRHRGPGPAAAGAGTERGRL